MRLVVEPLTKDAFRPFGEVIEVAGAEVRSINEGFAQRFHGLASIDVAHAGGRPVVSLFRALRRPMPIVIGMVERHPCGSQAFFPLEPAEWLVVVAEPHEAPSGAHLRCFRARGDQGVNYAVNIWHFPLLILAPRQDFLVIDRDGPGANLEEYRFPPGREAVIEIG